MFKKSVTGDILNISVAVTISEFSYKGLNIKQQYGVANILSVRVLRYSKFVSLFAFSK